MNEKVSIIIVNWNGLQHLKVCLESISKQSYRPIEVILVDNASTDESIPFVKKRFPWVKVIQLDSNSGFAHANNEGYKYASGNYVLFLNNDTQITSEAVRYLVEMIDSDPSIGGAQSKLLLMDSKNRYDSIGAYLTPTGFLYHNALGAKDAPSYDRMTDLYTAKGASMMFKANVLKKAVVDGELFDDDYFAYFEETDLCHRVWLLGYRVVYAYQSVVYHKMGATSSGMDNSFIQYHSFKNRIRTYLKNLNSTELCVILPAHIILSQCYAIYLAFKGQFAVFTAIQRAMIWNIQVIGDTLAKRRSIQSRVNKSAYRRNKSKIMMKPKFVYFIHLLLYGYSSE